MSQVITLQFKNGNTNEINYAKRPVRIQKDKKALIWNFVFDIEDEQQQKGKGSLAYFFVNIP
jgi:hypothetical protein